MAVFFLKGRHHFGKMRMHWLSAFSLLPTFFYTPANRIHVVLGVYWKTACLSVRVSFLNAFFIKAIQTRVCVYKVKKSFQRVATHFLLRQKLISIFSFSHNGLNHIEHKFYHLRERLCANAFKLDKSIYWGFVTSKTKKVLGIGSRSVHSYKRLYICRQTKRTAFTAESDDRDLDVPKGTHLNFLNDPDEELPHLYINKYSKTGFKLSTGVNLTGPIVFFPRSFLSWKVGTVILSPISHKPWFEGVYYTSLLKIL